jgi:hypothetical protein
VTLKDFVDNYNDIKTTLSTIKEKVKEIDWKYDFERLSAEQIWWVVQDFKDLINIIK